jgi:hypothetical protein
MQTIVFVYLICCQYFRNQIAKCLKWEQRFLPNHKTWRLWWCQLEKVLNGFLKTHSALSIYVFGG